MPKKSEIGINKEDVMIMQNTAAPVGDYCKANFNKRKLIAKQKKIKINLFYVGGRKNKKRISGYGMR